MDISIKSTRVADSLLFSQSVYLFEENSFINSEPNDVALMISQQYLSLDVSLKDDLITGVSGYFNIANCPEKSLEFLEGESGRLEIISAEIPLEAGIGYNYPIAGEAFYDKNKKVLQIGETTQVEETIQIAENILLGIAENDIIFMQIKINQ